MDVLAFECKDYKVIVSTATIEYAWDRFERRVKDAAQTYCEYKSSREGTLFLYDLKSTPHRLIAQNDNCTARTDWPMLWPVLFETCEYQFAVEFNCLQSTSDEKHRPRVRHQIKGVGENFKFYATGEHTGILVVCKA